MAATSKDTFDALLANGLISKDTHAMYNDGSVPDQTPAQDPAASTAPPSDSRLDALNQLNPLKNVTTYDDTQFDPAKAGSEAQASSGIGAQAPASAQTGLIASNDDSLPRDAVPVSGEIHGGDGVGIDPSQVAGAPPKSGNPNDPLSGIGGYYKGMLDGIANEGRGAMAMYGAQAAGQKNLSKLYDGAQRDQAVSEIDRQQAEAGRQAHAIALMRNIDQKNLDLNSYKVDPNRVWTSATTGQKISAALGLIFGGIGGAMTGHGGNAALDVINKTIDRDMDAQKMEYQKRKDAVGSAQNVYGMYMQQLGDQRAAESATRLALMKNVEMKAQSMTASMNGAALSGEAQMAMGNWQKQYNQTAAELQMHLYQNSMLYGAGQNGAANDPMQRANMRIRMEPDKEVKAEMIKELPEYQKHQANKAFIANSMDQMYQHANDYTPNGRKLFEAAQTGLLSQTTDMFGGKSEPEFGMVAKLSPGHFTDQKTFNTIKGSLMNKLDTMKSFPFLEGSHVVPREIKMEPHQ